MTVIQALVYINIYLQDRTVQSRQFKLENVWTLCYNYPIIFVLNLNKSNL